MSHELRTPLNAIIGYSELMLLGIDRNPLQDTMKLERIGFSARHLLELIDEILTFSRLESNEETPEIGEVVPEVVLSEVEALMEALAARKGIAFRCLRAVTPVGTMNSDTRKIRQIMIDLVANAIKFTDAGTVQLSLERKGDEIVYLVSDTGPGIAHEHHGKIFDPFWRVENSATRSTGGTGLGLSVSRRLARLLGGDITVSSEAQQGSTFRVRLPRQATSAPSAPPSARRSSLS